MLQKQEQTNIKTVYVLSLISEVFFPIAVWLFFYSRVLSFAEIAVLTGVAGFASILFEVSTGAFADLFGRRTAIVLSYIVFAVSMFGIALSNTFGYFLVFGILAALANALYSGSLEALVYDSLKENNEENLFEHVSSKMVALAWVGVFVGSVAGGFLYQVQHQLPYIVQGCSMILAGIISLRLKEPRIDSKTYSFSKLIAQNTTGFRELFQSKVIAITSILFILIAAGYDVASQILGISQAREYGIEPSTVGLVFGAGYVLSAVASYMFPRLRKMFGNTVLVLIAVTALLCSFIFAKFVGATLGAGLIILRIASSTTFKNSRSVIFNRVFTSRNRATALSTLNLLSSLPYVVLAYFIGDAIDKTSPNSFAFGLGLVLAVLVLIVAILQKTLSRSETNV